MIIMFRKCNKFIATNIIKQVLHIIGEKTMRIHSLEHEPFEGLANIELWAKSRGHSITRTLLFKNEVFPRAGDFDWLIIMGGSMSTYEEDKYPWLVQEKEFIARAIEHKKIVLGVCLGSQLIAGVLGGRVTRNKYKEIGWHPVTLTEEGKRSPIFSNLPGRFTVFQWHGDTFSIPPGATRVAKSEGCPNQAFQCGCTVGLQFHIEYSTDSINSMFSNCGGDIVDGKFIQKPEEIISRYSNTAGTQKILNLLLDNMEREFGTT